jgi:hypothetical protein
VSQEASLELKDDVEGLLPRLSCDEKTPRLVCAPCELRGCA